jgi:O-antigen ligase
MSILSAKVSEQRRSGASGIEYALEIVLATLLVTALLSIQALIGGTRLIFALPAYASLALTGVLSIALVRAARPAPHRLCLWSAVIFFGYILVRAAISPAPYLARFDIYSVLAGLVVYFLTSCVLTSAKTRMSILACLLTAALAHALVGFIQFRGGTNFMAIHFLQRFNYGHRASGFYVCPNHLAGLLEVLGIFGLSIVCWSRWPVWAKLLVGYTTAICYLAVILTGSRGGFLSVVASWLVFAGLSLKILRAGGGANLVIRIGGAGLIGGTLAIAAAFLLIHQNDLLRDRAKKIASDDFRLGAWRAAIEQWKLDPVWGTGSGTYLFYGRKYRAEGMQRDPVYTHNDYLQLAAEYGAVGAGLFLIFFAVHWRHGWIDARRLGPKRIAISRRLASNAMAINIGALGALAAYVVHSIFDFNLHIPANLLLLAFVFGIVANPGVNYDAASEKTAARGLIFWRLLLVALAAVLGVQTWRLAPGEYYTERARTALRDYRFLSAIDYALKAVKYETQNPSVFYYLGRARVLGGDVQRSPEAAASFYEAALPAYIKARELAPLDKTYALELAFTYDSLKRYGEAEGLYYEARLLDPGSTSTEAYYRAHLERWKGIQNAPNR